MSIILPTRAAARAAMLALSIAGFAAAGVTGASASAIHPDTTRCTASNPEICFSIVAVSGGFTLTEQVHFSGGTVTGELWFTGPAIPPNGESQTFSGWSEPPYTHTYDFPPTVGGTYCGNFGQAPNACVVWE